MNIYAEAVGKLKLAINSAIEKAISEGDLPQAELPDFIIETPADRSHGDFATNAAMAGAKAFHMPPFKIAQVINTQQRLFGLNGCLKEIHRRTRGRRFHFQPVLTGSSSKQRT